MQPRLRELIYHMTHDVCYRDWTPSWTRAYKMSVATTVYCLDLDYLRAPTLYERKFRLGQMLDVLRCRKK